MGTALRNTEPNGAASNNRPFLDPQLFVPGGVDVESAPEFDHRRSVVSLPKGAVLGRSHALLVFAAAVVFVLLIPIPAHAQDGALTDSDADGLSDGVELAVFGTDPQAEDTDGDGLADGVEVELGLDPLKPDSDGDGFNDASEYLAGSDPLLRFDTPYGMVATDIPPTESTEGPVIGQTTITVSPQSVTVPSSLAFDESQTGRSPLFPLFISIASAIAVGMAFLLAMVPEVGSTVETGDLENR